MTTKQSEFESQDEYSLQSKEEADEYQQFVEKYAAPREFMDPMNQPRETYELPDKNKTLKMVENIITYKNELHEK